MDGSFTPISSIAGYPRSVCAWLKRNADKNFHVPWCVGGSTSLSDEDFCLQFVDYAATNAVRTYTRTGSPYSFKWGTRGEDFSKGLKSFYNKPGNTSPLF